MERKTGRLALVKCCDIFSQGVVSLKVIFLLELSSSFSLCDSSEQFHQIRSSLPTDGIDNNIFIESNQQNYP